MEQKFLQWQPRWYTERDGRADTTELRVAFRGDAEEPQNAFPNFSSSLVSSEEANVITSKWEAVFPFTSCSSNSSSSCRVPTQKGLV